MLSDISIKKYLESGDIIIDPWHEDMMGAARVTLHLGKKILVPKGRVVVDVMKKTVPMYDAITLKKGKPFRFKSGMFILGETHEHVGLSEKVGMLIDGRSTLGRVGLTVTQTSMIIDTGQKPKTMTLEIKNNGPHDIMLYLGMKFCRACFFKIDPPASIRYDTDGKYLEGDSHKPIFRKGEIT